MNIFIAATTALLLTFNIAADKAKNEGSKPVAQSTTKKHEPLDKSIKPKTSTPIPPSIMEEKLVAEVVASKGDTIKYKPFIVPRKIKH